jgi:HAD superfamily, subfamily IIIB (Acid phosphatase)
MRRRPSAFLRGVLLLALGAVLASAALAVAGVLGSNQQIWQTSKSDGTPVFGNRPTGVGLPIIDVSGTTGAGDYAAPLKTYHDSGDYGKDLATVDGAARAFLTKRLAQFAAQERNCRKHKPARQCRQPKPAMVLDIDETSLSNYTYLANSDFKNAPGSLATAAITGTSPAIAPTLKLFNFAKRKGVAVFFITGRPTLIQAQTESNLTSAGYSGWKGLVLNPGGGTVIEYKSGARGDIEDNGYRIIVNVGDQESDLAGGHAIRAYKLPNPFYFIP